MGTRRRSAIQNIMILLVAAAGLAAVAGCKPSEDVPDSGPGFQAVLLDNGQAYFGKLTWLNTQYVKLTDVYYVQRQVDTETGQVLTNRLVKRGREWHSPDHMIINTAHIIFIENVKSDSDVIEAIEKLSGS